MSFLSRLFGNRRRNTAILRRTAPAPRRARPALEGLEDRCVPTASAIVSNFNGSAVGPGSTLWFSSVMKVNGLGSSPVTLQVTNQEIDYAVSGTSVAVSVPDAQVTLSPTVTTASTVFDAAGNTWDTVLPFHFSGNAFLSGVAEPLPNGLPGGVNPVTWH